MPESSYDFEDKSLSFKERYSERVYDDDRLETNRKMRLVLNTIADYLLYSWLDPLEQYLFGSTGRS